MKTYTFASPGTNLARRLEQNRRGRDLVVGDIHGHFATLRHALAELEVGEHDRVFRLGDLVDHGPDSWAAKSWIAGPHASERFHLTIRGNHEQLMLAGLATGPRYGRRRLRDIDDWSIWRTNGGRLVERAQARPQRPVLDGRPLRAPLVRPGCKPVRLGGTRPWLPGARELARPRGMGARI